MMNQYIPRPETRLSTLTSGFVRTLLRCPLWLLAMVFIACAYGEGEKPSARACYEQAMQAFDDDSIHRSEQLLHSAINKARSEGDSQALYLSQLQLSRSLSWSSAEKALDMAKQALDTYERHVSKHRDGGNIRHLISILDYIGTYASQVAYNNDTGFDEAMRYATRAYELAESAGITDLVSQTLTSMANIYWATDNYPEALRCAHQAADCATPELLLGVQQVLARCLVSCDSLVEAERIYRSMECGKDIQASYIVQSNLAKLALRRQDVETASEAIDEAFGRAEELYFDALAQKDAYYQTSIQQERENERLRYRQVLHKWMFGCGVLMLLMLLFVVVWVMKQRRREQSLHQREKDFQYKQLRQRDATVDFLKNFIYQRSEVVKKLSDSNARHVVLTPRDWEEVERMLNAIDAGRFARLRGQHPEMKEEDVQLCILTRLRLSNRAIGNVYAITISAVQHRKLKVKKEIFEEADPDITLEQVLDAI